VTPLAPAAIGGGFRMPECGRHGRFDLTRGRSADLRRYRVPYRSSSFRGGSLADQSGGFGATPNWTSSTAIDASKVFTFRPSPIQGTELLWELFGTQNCLQYGCLAVGNHNPRQCRGCGYAFAGGKYPSRKRTPASLRIRRVTSNSGCRSWSKCGTSPGHVLWDKTNGTIQ